MLRLLYAGMVFMLAAMPASSTYKLNNYTFGSGGTAGSTSTTYGVNGTVGEQSTLQVTGSAYKAQPGDNYTQNAAVPIVTITNPATYYNKLLVTIDTQGNPTDTIYAIAISTDNFTTTNYVKSDNTVTGSLTYPTDYRTYSSWGSGSGTLVIGLTPGTTYYVKAKAMRGSYTESAYGPVSSVGTNNAILTLGITTVGEAVPPFNVGFGTLNIGAANAGDDQINLVFTTNATAGGDIYIVGSNGSLHSTRTNGDITSLTADLTAVNGYGAQGTSATQVSGGPFTRVSPFNNSGNNVGIVGTTYTRIFTSANPVTTGSGSIIFIANPSNVTPAATDYAETITLTASGSF